MFPRDSDAISPTAHYTGDVWRRNDLSDPALGTWQGRALHLGLLPLAALGEVLGTGTLDDFLLARHRMIDEALELEIEAGRVGQVVEIAAGLSPRGLRFRRAHPEVEYVEADLPAMAERKRAALADAGSPHRVADLDALAPRGPGSLHELIASLDQEAGTAIVTEGLLNYFPRADVVGIWARIAAGLKRFPRGIYLADLHLRNHNSGPAERAFGLALSVFVRGSVHFPCADEQEAAETLAVAGFGDVRLRSGAEAGGGGAARVTVIEARTS